MLKRVAILLLLIAGAAPALPPGQVPTTQHVRTAHYELEAEVAKPQAVKMAALLEAYFEQASAYFGKAPPASERLRVVVLANFDRFIQRLKSDGMYAEIAQGADGAYCENNGVIYLSWNDPPALTHGLLLHEATHQFEALVRTNEAKSSLYVEGVAEYLGHHRWENGRLTLGVAPTLEPHDRPAQALERFHARFGGDLWRVVLEQENEVAHYGDAWAVYAFLAEEEPQRLKTWARLLDEGKEAEPAWQEALEGVTGESISRRYKSWLESHQWKWECASSFFAQESDWIEGACEEKKLGIALLKTPVDDLTIEIEVQSEHDQAGLAVGFTSRNSGSLVNLLASGELRSIWIVDGKASAERLPGIKQRRPWRWTMRARRVGDEMLISIDGKTYAKIKVPPDSRCGLSVIGSARFRVLENKE